MKRFFAILFIGLSIFLIYKYNKNKAFFHNFHTVKKPFKITTSFKLKQKEIIEKKIASERRNVIVQSIEEIGPAVVNISATKTIKNRFYSPFFDDDFFEMFAEPRTYEQNILGSGLVIDKKGYILTNEHVVQGAEEIMITFKDGKKYKGTVIGQDKNRDIAVIKIKENNLPIAKLGNSNDLMIGEWVVAIGNPFGLENTVTVGVISGTNRSLRPEKNTNEMFENLIQTDTSINPGNSGGPLVNVLGEVIGINTAIYQNAQGIGFAIPINIAKKIAEDIVNYKKVREIFLGIHVQEITPEIAKILNISQKGVLISDITKNSPAEKAGLKIKDVIIKINKENISNISTFKQGINQLEINEKTYLTLIRNNKEITTTIIPQEKKHEEDISNLLGMKVRTISSEIKKKYEFYSSQGVVVIEVIQGKWADKIGIQKGDVIIKINNISIQSINDYSKILSKMKKGQGITMFLERGFSTLYLQTNIN